VITGLVLLLILAAEGWGGQLSFPPGAVLERVSTPLPSVPPFSQPADARVTLLPKLKNHDKLHYETHANLERQVQTKSRVNTMLGPRALHGDLSSGLWFSVQEFRIVGGRPMLAAEASLDLRENPADDRPLGEKRSVNFTIEGDGRVGRADGLDALEPVLALTWQFWVAQFATGWTVPKAGVKPGDTWKTEEPEKTPTPIAQLFWERETTYVENSRCPFVAEEDCAVLYTSATLTQKSPAKDTTPDDYRLHELKTSGTVQGENDTVTYISLKTGLMVRASEESHQHMNVTISKRDGSNEVQYRIDVSSRMETVLVPEPNGVPDGATPPPARGPG